MRFASLAAIGLAFALSAASAQVTKPVTYDNTYDNPSYSLENVACSNGANGLLTKGFTTLGSLPNFPYIGGVYTVAWNSPNCGACYNLTYEGTTISILAVDAAGDFNLSEEAMNKLTGGKAVQLGKVYASSVQVPASVCGMK